MTCPCCSVIWSHFARDPWHHKHYSVGCAHCGARLIQYIQTQLSLPASQKAERCRAALSRWMSYGHGEQEIRDLAKRRTAGKAPIWAIAPKAEKA